MQQIQWQDRFNIGVEIVDQAHRRLFSIVEKIMELYVERHEDRFACVEGIKYFIVLPCVSTGSRRRVAQPHMTGPLECGQALPTQAHKKRARIACPRPLYPVETVFSLHCVQPCRSSPPPLEETLCFLRTLRQFPAQPRWTDAHW